MLRSSALAVCLVLSACHCPGPRIETEARAVDELMARLRSDEFSDRQTATTVLLSRESASLRDLVVPRLALESAGVPLEIRSKGGNIVRGRVTGGDERALELVLTNSVAPGAVVRLPCSSIEVIRIFTQ